MEVCVRNVVNSLDISYIIVHITPENILNPDITLNHGNLEYVCKDCHDKFDGHGVNNKRQGLLVMFDENGQPIAKL